MVEDVRGENGRVAWMRSASSQRHYIGEIAGLLKVAAEWPLFVMASLRVSLTVTLTPRAVTQFGQQIYRKIIVE